MRSCLGVIHLFSAAPDIELETPQPSLTPGKPIWDSHAQLQPEIMGPIKTQKVFLFVTLQRQPGLIPGSCVCGKRPTFGTDWTSIIELIFRLSSCLENRRCRKFRTVFAAAAAPSSSSILHCFQTSTSKVEDSKSLYFASARWFGRVPARLS